MNLKLSSIDCETANDFHQYYHSRYFAIKENNCLIPCQELGFVPRTAFLVGRIEGPNQKHFHEVQLSFDEIKKIGVFGRPLLGTVLYGDSYNYIWDYARRESVKGFSLQNVSKWQPDKFGVSIEVEEQLETFVVWNIYNPTFFTWSTALTLLSNGERIGCPLTYKIGLYLMANCPDILVSYKYNTIGRTDGHAIYLNERFKHLREIIRASLSDVEVV